MEPIVIITGGAVAAVATGAYLRWALRPVMLAYWVGKHVERLAAAGQDRR